MLLPTLSPLTPRLLLLSGSLTPPLPLLPVAIEEGNEGILPEELHRLLLTIAGLLPTLWDALFSAANFFSRIIDCMSAYLSGAMEGGGPIVSLLLMEEVLVFVFASSGAALLLSTVTLGVAVGGVGSLGIMVNKKQ